MKATNKPKILFTTPVLKHPATGGPYLRVENSIKALAQISDISIYSRVSLDALGGASGLTFYEKYCQGFYFAPSTFLEHQYIKFSKRAINFFSRRLLKKEIFNSRQELERESRDLLKIANQIKADVIWLGYGNISYPLLAIIKEHSSYQVVVDTDSIWSRFILRELPFAKSEEERQEIENKGKEKESEETWGTQLADVTTAVSEIDAEYYKKLSKNLQQVHLFSNVIDIEMYQDVPAPVSHLKKPCIYLAGTFWERSPMEDAARWVIEKVLPLVRQQIPDIHFYIIGSGSDRILSDIDEPGITITGRLPSVLPYLCHADVALVPLRFESGTRFKILEAGACGIPIVSTTLGAEGLPVIHNKDILIADEPESFSEGIIKMIKNPDFAQMLADNLKNLVQSQYSIASLVTQGNLILNYLYFQ